MRGRRTRYGALAALLVVTACSGVAKAPEQSTAAPGYLALATSRDAGGTLRLEVAGDVVEATGLDPQGATLAASWALLSLSYESLVTIGPGYTVRPELATSWDQPSPTRYVFHLRSGVRFANGRAMTADDVVGSLNRLAKSQTVWRAQLGPVRSVRKVDAATVQVDLSRPYTPFLAALGHVGASILPMREVAAKQTDPARTVLGTGPFAVVDHRQDVSWTLRRNPHYWQRGRPAVDRVEIQVVANNTSRSADLRSGSADVVQLSSTDDPANFTGTSDVRVVSQSSPDFYYLILNSQRPGSRLADRRVRQALASALDRRQIADTALSGLSDPTGIVPTGLPGACDPAALPTQQSTIRQAKQQLSAAGAARLRLRLAVPNSDPLQNQIAQVVQQQLDRIGVRVTIDTIDPGSFTKAFNAKPSTFDAAISGFAGYADPGMVIRWWNPKLAGFSANFKGDDPTLDRLIDQVQTTSGSGRATRIRQLCARADEGADMVPLVTYPSIVGYRTDRVSPTFLADEGYGEPWRRLADFRRIGG